MKTNKIIKAMYDFCIYFINIFILLLIIGKIGGFTPMEIKPLSWKELFSDDNLIFILIMSFLFSLFTLYLKREKCKEK